MSDFTDQKNEFIQEVSALQDERQFSQLVAAYREIKARDVAAVKQRLRRPLRRKLNPEVIKRGRGFKGHDKAEIYRLIKEIDIQEPIELLLSQLTR